MNEIISRFSATSLKTRIALIAALLLVLLIFTVSLGHSVPVLERWIASSGPWAPVFFSFLFAVLTPLFFSVDALCFAAGFLFGFWRGLLWVSVGTFLSATLMFLVGRYLARDKVQTLLERNPTLSAVQSMLGEDPLRLMFLLRLLPIPFAMLSYALSVTRVEFRHYLAATSGVLVYHVAMVYLGFVSTHVARSVGQGTGRPLLHWLGLAGSVLLAAAIVAYIVRSARDAIDRLRPGTSSDGAGMTDGLAKSQRPREKSRDEKLR
jgi:uncharacterized membrane protein YdjX (TVP38/TMEM64 family)